MSRRTKVLLYGPTGKPLAASFYGREFYQGGRRWTPNNDQRPILYQEGARDSHDLLQYATWKELLSVSRFLFANVPMLRGALLEQASLAFPLEAQYTGADKEFGRRAESWLYDWRKIANVKGPAYDALACSRIRLLGRRVDGDILNVLTMTANGYPKLQFIRAHRLMSREDGELRSGPFRGSRINNGVVLTPWGAPRAYLIPGDTESDDQYIDAANGWLSFRPDYSDLDRGIPELAACIMSFDDLRRLREYEMRAQQIGAAIALLEKNESGFADMASAAVALPETGEDTSDTAAGLVTQTFEGGLVKYFRSGSGSGLEAFRQDRPSADAQAFEDKIVTGAFAGIEWDASYTLAIKEPGGAWARTIIQKIRRCIQHIQFIEARDRLREDVYALAKAIKLGILEGPADSDIFSWEYKAPAQITADSGNEENAKRESYKLGLETMKSLEGEKGRWWQETREQREAEAIDLLMRARKIQSQFPELTLQECITLLEQRSPNPQSPTETVLKSEPQNA